MLCSFVGACFWFEFFGCFFSPEDFGGVGASFMRYRQTIPIWCNQKSHPQNQQFCFWWFWLQVKLTGRPPKYFRLLIIWMFARIWIHLQFLTVGSCLKVFPLVIVMSSGKFRCGTFHRHNITRLAWGPPCTLFYMDSLGKHYFCWTSTTPPQNTSWP